MHILFYAHPSLRRNKGASGGGGNAQSGRTFHPIASLNPYQSRWYSPSQIPSVLILSYSHNHTHNTPPTYIHKEHVRPSRATSAPIKSSALCSLFFSLCSLLSLSALPRTIKARVTSKGDIRTWNNARGEGKLFSVDFLDKVLLLPFP
jgi:hypothetical protein